MASTIAIVNIGQLVTLAGATRPRVGPELRELAIFEDAAMMVEGGRIIAAGRYDALKSNIAPDADVIDVQGRCVTPGFVDAHTHLVFAGNRAAEFEQRIGGRRIKRLPLRVGGFCGPSRLREPQLKTNYWLGRAAIVTGCCAQAPQHLKQNLATGLIARPN